MVGFRQARIMVAILISCTEGGCLAFYSTRPVELVLTRTESAQPVANEMVILSYNHSIFQGVPGEVVDATDQHGHVVLPIAEVSFRMTLQVGRAVFSLDRDIVRTGGVLRYGDEEDSISLRVVPKSPTFIQRLFGFGLYGTCGAL
jgi:hypothetical protein